MDFVDFLEAVDRRVGQDVLVLVTPYGSDVGNVTVELRGRLEPMTTVASGRVHGDEVITAARYQIEAGALTFASEDFEEAGEVSALPDLLSASILGRFRGLEIEIRS